MSFLLPLTPGQRGLWFLHRLHPDSPAYHLALASRIRSSMPTEAIRGLFQEQVDRHEALRTTFPLDGDEPVQHVADRAELAFEEIDAAGWDEATFRARLEEEAWKPFDLEHGPLFRVQIFQRASERVLLVVVHHIVVDFGSFAGMLSGAGGEAPQYRDFLQWQTEMLEGAEGEALWSFWQERLAGLSVLELPTDRPRRTGAAERGGCRWREVGPEVVRPLKALARSQGGTLYVALLAGFQALLSRYTGQTDFAVGSPASGRPKGFARAMGYFTNPLPVRADVSGEPSFRDLLGRVRERVSEALDHQHLPLPVIVERRHEGAPFRTLFVFHRDPSGLEGMVGFALGEGGGLLRWGDLELEPLALPPRAAQFDVSLAAGERRGALGLQIVYDADLFDAPTAARWLEHLAVLLEAASAHPDVPVIELPLLTAWERQQVLVEVNDPGEVDLPWSRLEEGFERQAERTPEAVAVIDGERQITYRELRDRATALACHLSCLKGQVVGVKMPRSAEMVASLLGILKAGATYLPLDPSYPEERINFLLEDAGASCVLEMPEPEFSPAGAAGISPGFQSRDSGASPNPRSPARGDRNPADEPLSPLPGLVDGVGLPIPGLKARANSGRPCGADFQIGDEVAYLIYTSGSTGRPKGVAIEHTSAVRLVAWAGRTYAPEELSGVLASTSINFDLSIFEIFVPLSFGGTVILAENALALPTLPAAGEVTLINTVPSAIAALLDLGPLPPKVRTVNLAGEPLRRSLAERVLASDVKLWDLYGPSEDTTYSTGADIRSGDPGEPPIGWPVAGSRAYVVDAALHPLPIGIPGELCLGGGGLARGYLGRPELTAEKFVPDPFSGGRLYRTGDLARRRPDGTLEYLGRLDHQVKIRGFRIEPGEIEAVLLSHPDVREAVVVARDGALVAYVSLTSERPDLAAYLRSRLPAPFMPSAFVVLPALPLTPNGKVDRKALPAPEQSLESFEAPAGPVEEVLAAIWAEVLGLDRIGRHQSFFELGGHSLLAVRVLSRASRQFGVDLPVGTLFEAPTVAALAGRIPESTGEAPPPLRPMLVPHEGREDLPLSFAQQRLWFLDRLQPGSAAYNLPGVVRLMGPLDRTALASALGEVQRRHEMLRTVFPVRNGEPMQAVLPPAAVPLPVVDLAGLPAAMSRSEADRLAGEEARTPFDLARGPVWRVRLLLLRETEHLLVANLHHIAADGWSLGPLLREIAALYEGSALPDLPVQYADYAIWQRGWMQGEVLERQLDWWRERLAGLPALELPVDRARPAVRDLRGGVRALGLPPETSGQVERLARGQKATPFMTLLAVFQALLARYTGEEVIAVGSPVANRRPLEVEPLIGFFVNTLVLAVRAGDDPPFRKLLERVRTTCLGAYAHQDLPFERLVEELHPGRDLSQSPLYQVAFQVEEPLPLARSADLSLEVRPVENGTSKLDLTLSVLMPSAGSWLARAEHASTFEPSTIDRLLGHWRNLVAGAIADPGARLYDLPLLSDAERSQLLGSARTEGLEVEERCLHHLFEEQVRLAPEALAVVLDEETLTYRELEDRANRLACYLLDRGLQPETPVAVLLGRSPDLVVTLLAVLKAGGAYLPLDPSWPRERHELLLADSGAAVLVSRAALAGGLGTEAAASPARVLLDMDAPAIAARSARVPQAAVGPRSLAYLIYTSGSTGRPKPVGVEHGAASLHCAAIRRAYGLGPRDRVLAFASPAFDASLEQILSSLTAGAAVVLRGERDWEIQGLGRRIAELRLSVINLPMAYWVLWVREGDDLGAVGSGLRLVIAGAEEMPSEAIRLWHRSPLAGIRLLNAYGPTEAVITATLYEARAGGSTAAVAPIGRPLPGRLAYILDGHGDLLPAGVPGELALGGLLARGYPGASARTAERFVPDPFGATPGARLYRTGDLVRWRRDGEIEFLGRIDRQVKIRGVRVEPGEVEAVLARHPGVARAAVLVQGRSDGDRRLVAFVVAASSGVLSLSELRVWLEAHLPPSFIPRLATIPELPLTSNGKVDRAALARSIPELEAGNGPDAGSTAPQSPAEELLVGIWAEVLGRERIGVEDDFFALGGHSLLATRLVSRIFRAFGVDLPVSAVFRAPTIAALAREVAVAAGGGEVPPLRPDLRQHVEREDLPLSFAQERLWFLDRLEPGSAAYNMPVAVRLRGDLDVSALERSLGEILRRHEVLRTTFREEPSGPVQVVAPPEPFQLPLAEAGSLDEEARRPFDLERGPVFRAHLFQQAPGDHLLLVNLHHIASDGWSLGVLVRELAALYSGYSLPELPVQYADYARWQRSWLSGETLAVELAWWREALEGLPERLDLPTDHPRRSTEARRGDKRPVRLGAALMRQINNLARHESATPFMVILAAFQALLGRWANQEDLAVGSPIAGRTRVEVENLIGFFVNTLVLRGDLRGDPTVRGLLAQTRRTVLTAHEHQHVPFEKLVEELAPARDLGRTPLFEAMLAFQTGSPGAPELPGLQVEVVPVETGTAKFDLLLDLTEHEGELAGWLEYDADLFEAPTLDRLLRHFAALLSGMVASPEERVFDLPLLSDPERHQLLAEWNDQASAEPDWTLLHEGFERQAERTPNAVAVIWGEERLTYRDLDERAEGLAWDLRNRGAGPERIIGISLPRTPDMIVAMLAVLKSGSAYVPLDPSYPSDRTDFLIADAGVDLLIGSPVGAAGISPGFQSRESGAPPTPRSPARGDRNPSGEPLPPLTGLVTVGGLPYPGLKARANSGRPCGASSAYLIYTSGSTGRPKGVAIEHRSAVRLVAWALETFSRDELSGVLAATSINFDLSIFEIFVPLSCGGTVILADDALALPTLPAAGEVTLINTVPSAMAALLDLGPLPRSVRTVNLAGEPLRRALADRVYDAGVERLWNLYGPSEDTTYSTGSVVERGPEEPSIGRPVAGSLAYVADASLRLQPLGVPGELCLGGGGLARGYLNRPELTAERFVPDPFGAPGGRLYRTGDRVRRQPDGALDYLGRLDRQVKIRGFRIEPGEIEAVLLAHPVVREAAVLPRDGSLVAYVVAEPDDLRAWLAGRLPAPLVPSAFVRLDALPLTPNGKVDRAALARIAAPVALEGFEPPRGAAEETLAAIWSEVLGLDRIGRHDRFFDLGGHSLLATRVVARARNSFGMEIPVRALFEESTIAGLARWIAREAHGGMAAPPLVPAPQARPAPLSFAQQRLWFLAQLDPTSAVYNLPVAVRLHGPLDADILERALTGIVRRHETLRTTFQVFGNEPAQVVAEPQAFPLPRVDLRVLGERAEAEARRLTGEEALRPFDLQQGPLFRTLLLQLGDEEHRLLVTQHHTISDGWSLGVFVRELAALYRDSPLPELAVQYSDFAVWQRQWLSGEMLERGLAFWKEQLQGLPPGIELPTDRPRPPVQTFRGASRPLSLEPGLTRHLRALAREEGATLFMILMAGFQALLARWSGQDDLAVGTPVAGRTRVELEGLIGFFVNTLVLRGDLGGNPDFLSLLARTRERFLAAQAHQDLPFERLVEELKPERSLSRPPLFQVLLVLQNTPREPLALPGLEVLPLAVETGTAKFELHLTLIEEGDGLAASLEFNRDLFDATTADRLLGQYAALLSEAVTSPGRRLSELEVLLPAERHQILVEYNAGAPSERGRPIHAYFEEQAALRPEAPAVVCGDDRLTYGELDHQSKALARRLRRLGVGPEERVAICLDRSVGMLVAILATLRAGGAYVPLDPEHPAERQTLVLEDAAPRVLITSPDLAERPVPPGLPVVFLSQEGEEPGEDLPPVEVLPSNAAYVIYTSGSTGRPKGVVVTHFEAVRLLTATRPWFGFGPDDIWAIFFSFAFDFSVWEIWGALAHGGRLVVVPYWVSRSPESFLDLLASERVTVLNQTPSAFRQLVQEDADHPRELSLRHVVFGGEALDLAILAPWIARHGDSRPRLINMYGITETTVHSTYRPIRSTDLSLAPASPIGVPIPDLQIHVLDRWLQPAPFLVPGEICVGGDGLARGYLGRPDLTAQRFVPDPFGGRPGARLYRSGDLARQLPHGDVEYLGRIDFQVKIRGFRIELGEIEAVLAAQPAVRDAVVLAREDRPGDRRLVAYLVPRNGDLRIEELRSSLRERLPEYMVPAAFVVLEALPLTANGKLDRRALPAPDRSARAAIVPPRTETEQAIAGAWREALGLEAVGVDDNFFDLGGHSLLVVQVHRQLAPSFPGLAVVDLFRYPTISALAQFLSREKVEQVSLEESRERAESRADRTRRQRDLRRQVRPGPGSRP